MVDYLCPIQGCSSFSAKGSEWKGRGTMICTPEGFGRIKNKCRIHIVLVKFMNVCNYCTYKSWDFKAWKQLKTAPLTLNFQSEFNMQKTQ